MPEPTVIISDVEYRKHRTPFGHPESPARFDAVMRGIARISTNIVHQSPRTATLEEIALCHGMEYIESVRKDVLDPVGCLRTGDTDVCRDSLDVALLAAGGLLTAVDAVAAGDARNAFCAVRPPGHHACRNAGMGFCIFNNIAIAARYAQRRYGMERVLIVDWDVHHGNGTQDIFYDDPDVLYFSVHQWPLYPGTGRKNERGVDAGRGFTLNCPVAAGAGLHEFRDAFQYTLMPAAKAFHPHIVMISAGFDAGVADPLGGLALRPEDFASLTRITMEIADRHCDGRIISALEGGYNLTELENCVFAHTGALANG